MSRPNLLLNLGADRGHRIDSTFPILDFFHRATAWRCCVARVRAACERRIVACRLEESITYAMQPLPCDPAKLEGLSEKPIAADPMILHEVYLAGLGARG